MSAGYVRTVFRQWAQTVSAATGFGFFDTINQEQNPGDAVWWTAEFFSEFYEGTFCAPDFIEIGFIRVTVLARPGIGDTAAVAAIEQIIPALLAETDAAGRLILGSVEPVQEASGGDADRNYRVSMNLNYQYSQT